MEAINPATNSNDDAGDILNALSIGTITATVASERGIYIGTNYDTDLVFGDTTPVVAFGVILAISLLPMALMLYLL